MTLPLDPMMLLAVAAIAFAAAVLGGVAGYGTGLILPPVLAPLIGGEAVVPVVTLAALISNAGRVIAFRHTLDRSLALRLILVAIPTTILGAYGFTLLNGKGALILIGTTLLIMVPLRRLAKKHRLKLSTRGVMGAAAGYGIVVGGTAGSGVMLLSILMAAGLSGASVIATDAAISMSLGSVKTATFLATGALQTDMMLLALVIGAACFPAAFLSKRLTVNMGDGTHLLILDSAVVLGGILLVWEGLRA